MIYSLRKGHSHHLKITLEREFFIMYYNYENKAASVLDLGVSALTMKMSYDALDHTSVDIYYFKSDTVTVQKDMLGAFNSNIIKINNVYER